MSRLTLKTSDGRTAFEPGEKVEAGIQWRLDEVPEAIEIRLAWHTTGDGDIDSAVVERRRIEHPAAHQSRRWRFTCPNGPYSFCGQLFSLSWAVELIVLPSGESRRLNITIAPRAKAVRL